MGFEPTFLSLGTSNCTTCFAPFDFTLQSLSRFSCGLSFLTGTHFYRTYNANISTIPIGHCWHVIRHFNTQPPCCSSKSGQDSNLYKPVVADCFPIDCVQPIPPPDYFCSIFTFVLCCFFLFYRTKRKLHHIK